MTGNKGVATAVAAPTIVHLTGNGATLLGGVAAASLRRRAGLSRRVCCLCGAFTAQLRSAPLRSTQFRINGRARMTTSISAQRLRRVLVLQSWGSQFASVLQPASCRLHRKIAVAVN